MTRKLPVRRLLPCLVLAAMLAGCAPEPEQRVVRPDGWIWAQLLQEAHESWAECAGVADSPQIGPVLLSGLNTRLAWLPGQGHFTFVQPDEAGQGTVQISLRPATDEAAEVITREVAGFEPAIVQFPGPGCWEMTVAHAGREGTATIEVEPALSVGFATAGESEEGIWGDTELAIAVLDQIARNPMPLPSDRRGVKVKLVWGSPNGEGSDTVLYFPPLEDKPALLAVSASRITGQCTDNDRAHAGVLAGEAAIAFAERLQDAPTVHGHTVWSGRPGQCLSFAAETP